MIPEMRAFFDEIAPMMERSEELQKLSATVKRVGWTQQNRIEFWFYMRELLSPHPELYQRMSDLLHRQTRSMRPPALGPTS